MRCGKTFLKFGEISGLLRDRNALELVKTDLAMEGSFDDIPSNLIFFPDLAETCYSAGNK